MVEWLLFGRIGEVGGIVFVVVIFLFYSNFKIMGLFKSMCVGAGG